MEQQTLQRKEKFELGEIVYAYEKGRLNRVTVIRVSAVEGIIGYDKSLVAGKYVFHTESKSILYILQDTERKNSIIECYHRDVFSSPEEFIGLAVGKEYLSLEVEKSEIEQTDEKLTAVTYNSVHEGYAHIVDSLEYFWSHAKTHGLCDSVNEELDSIQSMEVYLRGLIKNANITLNTLGLMRKEIFKEVEQYQNEGVID